MTDLELLAKVSELLNSAAFLVKDISGAGELQYAIADAEHYMVELTDRKQ